MSIDDVVAAAAKYACRCEVAAMCDAPVIAKDYEDFVAAIAAYGAAERRRCAQACDDLAEWVACDCGCEGEKPKGPRDCAFVQAAARIRLLT